MPKKTNALTLDPTANSSHPMVTGNVKGIDGTLQSGPSAASTIHILGTP
jgi:hypothetical protein